MDSPNARPRFQTVVVEEESTSSPAVPPVLTNPLPEPTVQPTIPSNPVVVAPVVPQNIDVSPMVDPRLVSTSNSGSSRNSIRVLLFLIPAFLMIGTIVAVSMFLQSRSQNKQIVEASPTPLPLLTPATPAPTLEPIAKNKSYLNSQFLFSLAYPEIVSLVECSDKVLLHVASESIESTSLCTSEDFVGIQIVSSTTAINSPVDGVEEVITVGGVDALKVSSGGATYATFSKETVNKKKYYYQFIINDPSIQVVFDQIIKNFRFILGTETADWEVYNNSAYRFSIKHPSGWVVSTPDAQTVEIRKEGNDSKIGALVIQAENNVSDGNLNAQETVSSLKNLAGWKQTPSTDFRTIGGGSARILQGEFEGNWQEYVVVWYKTRVLQMTWTDTLAKYDQELLDAMLSTLVIKN